jgi:hypothetical protein
MTTKRKPVRVIRLGLGGLVGDDHGGERDTHAMDMGKTWMKTLV